jgi:bifunctional aspartokinase / homoserine dehydrogenase 1
VKVLKFGGSSLSNAERIKRVATIILDAVEEERVVVVVSAFQGITNQLLESARLAEAGDRAYERLYARLAQRHRSVFRTLHGTKGNASTASLIEGLLNDLRDVLHGIYLLRHCSPRALDVTASFGERLSALIISSYLQRRHPAAYVDARHIIVTDDQFTHAAVLFDRTNPSIRRYIRRLTAGRKRNVLPVVTGFIGSTDDGRTTTLGRNGSDYTAAILGAALDASIIEIWTDVDGVLSADPRAVPSAILLPHLSYEEAMELSYFGATVLHSATIAPAIRNNIPILIKNTLNPPAPGTLISRRADRWEGVAKGISSVDDCTLFTLRGMSMVGVPGTAERLFRSLASERVNVILISQASSEHTICFAARTTDAPATRKAITQEFHYELRSKLTTVDEKPAQTIVAIVGEGMKGTPGVSGKVFQALGRNSINISAIAQGASERNISFVIDSGQKIRALNVIHEAFFEKRKRLVLALIGVGNIGSALLKQLQQQRSFLLSRGFDVRVCGIADSRHSLISPDGLDLSRWRENLKASPGRLSPAEFARRIAEYGFGNAAIVDCTASTDVIKDYPAFVHANMHIITPNKKANVLPWKQYNALRELLQKKQKYFLYEANVGAGLPVISTLQDLVSSGDRIIRIEGILSGTLSYLFNTFDGSRPFSTCVRQAHDLGFTEPDPREDLSGHDIARKLLILGRQLGWKMNLDDIVVEDLVPPSLRRGPLTTRFYTGLAGNDRRMHQRWTEARSRGAVLRYVGTLKSRSATARLKEVPLGHPFASVKGSDNIIAFTTVRYAQTPLVVQGPGAGADVTAMGVFSDILKLLHYLPY